MIADWKPLHTGELTVLSPSDPESRDAHFVGEALAALATASDVVPVLDTVAVTATRRHWRCDAGLTARAVGRLPRGAVSVHCWLLYPKEPDRAAHPSFNNVPPAVLDETVAELLTMSDRLNASPQRRVSMGIQHFVPREATVLATVDSAKAWVRLRACYGLLERLADPLYLDEFTVRTADWAVHDERVVTKPTATGPALGGTETVRVAAERRDSRALDQATARRVARLAVEAAAALDGAFELEFAVQGTRIRLSACRRQSSAVPVAGSDA